MSGRRPKLATHERVVCVLPGYAIASTIFIPRHAAGSVLAIDKNEATVQFDDPGVCVRLPISHLRTEDHRTKGLK